MCQGLSSIPAAIVAARREETTMTEHPWTQTSAVPSVSEFTTSPLRNRLRLELEAPVAEVWELMGDLSRFPEYSAGLERVDVKRGDDGRCAEYTCYFKPVEKGSHGAVSRDVMKWYEPNRGYLSVEVEGDAGTDGAVAFMTLDPTPGGTFVNYEMYFHADDLDAMKAGLDEVNVDMADRLIGRFGGKVVERFVEK
jgi:Polyketide cyclase / dehydrase and lipid transport